ncbi:MAG: undecaprenyl-diphosphate phosphatase [Phycisphaeraceae bacterium]|nr:undecaprenyl-diphosphate phosphatase [Phycisphaeraceae bacterium]
MTWWEAIILGLVEGITEYLPVSSTGHLLVVQDLLGIGTEDGNTWKAANAFAICIQAGAIVAVLGLYWQRVRQGVFGMLGPIGIGKGDEAGLRLFINLVVAFMPAAVIGLIFDDMIEKYLFNAWTIVIAWAVGGVAILAVAFWKRGKSGDEHKGSDLDSLTWQMALTIGFIQCLAMMPGTSRSLVTIVGGILVGLHIAAAVEFSFLLGVVTLLAATVYKAREAGPLMLEEYGWSPMIIGSIAAWLSAVVAIKWMVSYLKKHGMSIFGYYRIAIAILVAALILTGTIDANTPQ